MGAAASAGILVRRGSVFAAPAADTPRGDLGNGTYRNPILGGDHPDAGAIRVGADYYLTHSSFDSAPGLAIWHSRDLVNWRLEGYALSRYYGNVWAPYLCEHMGTYYIYFPCDGRLYATSAASPIGPWSEPVALNIRGIDPAHIAGPGGRRYLHFSGGRMVELSGDGLSAISPVRTVFKAWPIPGDWRVECECLEAPKLFWRDGYCYLTVAQGGTAGPSTSHMVISARSRNVDGPWEFSPYNPIVHTARREERWWSQGHGRLVEAPDGSWWMTYHAYENGYRSLGRQTLLMPIEWTKDGWYRVPAGISPDQTLRKPPGDALAQSSFSDAFAAGEIGRQWQFYKGVGKSRCQVGDGRLRLSGDGQRFADGAFVFVTAPDHAYQVEVDVETDGQSEAGLVLFYDPEHASGLRIAADGLALRRVFAGSPVMSLHVPARRATLRVVNDHQDVEAFYALPGQPWQRVGRAWEVSGIQHNTLSGFRSVRPALYACGSGTATFRQFRYSSH